jgi:hypothetical protein
VGIAEVDLPCYTVTVKNKSWDIGSVWRGKKLPSEVRQKISNKMKGREPWNKTIPMSSDTKEKISQKLKGRVPPNKGKHPSLIVRQKISNKLKGRVPWNKGIPTVPWNVGIPRTEREKAAISNARRGKPAHNKGIARSNEEKEAISKGQRLRWQVRKQAGKDYTKRGRL